MIWAKMPHKEKVESIILHKMCGLSQVDIAARLLTTSHAVKDFCRRHGIRDWRQGARPGNKNAEVDGMGRNTIRRLNRRTLLEAGRDLYVCERCGQRSKKEHPRHHKDRRRDNNELDNIEILCYVCHAKEHLNDRIRSSRGTFA